MELVLWKYTLLYSEFTMFFFCFFLYQLSTGFYLQINTISVCLSFAILKNSKTCSTFGLFLIKDVYIQQVALRQTGDLSRVYPAARPMTAGIGSSTPRDPLRISGIEDDWLISNKYSEGLICIVS